MKAASRKHQVVRQDPEPFADIQRRQKCRDSGADVEVRKRIVEKFGQPDFTGNDVARIACYLLRFRKRYRIPYG